MRKENKPQSVNLLPVAPVIDAYMRIALTAIILIALTVAPTLGRTQADQAPYPLKDIEDSIRKNPVWVPKNLFPSPGDPIVVEDIKHYENEIYRFTLLKQDTRTSRELISHLNPLRESSLYIHKSGDFHASNYYHECYFTRAIAVRNTKYPISNKYHLSFDEYDKYTYKGKRTIFFPPQWESTLKGETVLEIWVEFSIRVNRGGFPLLSPSEHVRPIALRTISGIYLVVLTKRDPNEPLQFDTYENILGNAFKIVPPRNPRGGISQVQNDVRTIFLQRLRTKFSSAPFHAELEVDLPDEVIMVRNYKQNELLNNKYEQSGYVIRVFGELDIGVFIRFSVLTANHPRNKFYDPTAQEFGRYREAVIKAQRAAQEETCSHFRGRQEGPTCIIRSR